VHQFRLQTLHVAFFGCAELTNWIVASDQRSKCLWSSLLDGVFLLVFIRLVFDAFLLVRHVFTLEVAF